MRRQSIKEAVFRVCKPYRAAFTPDRRRAAPHGTLRRLRVAATCRNVLQYAATCRTTDDTHVFARVVHVVKFVHDVIEKMR